MLVGAATDSGNSSATVLEKVPGAQGKISSVSTDITSGYPSATTVLFAPSHNTRDEMAEWLAATHVAIGIPDAASQRLDSERLTTS